MKSRALRLENGMRAFVYSYPQMESVCVAVGVDYGSIDDRKENSGAAHYLEHMLFRGTKTRGTDDIKREVREMGLVQNAFTTFENTIYFMQGYSGYFSRMIGLLSDMVKNSTIPEREFMLEKGAVINENLLNRDNPESFFDETFGRVLFRKHPARMSVGGTNGNIRRMKRGTLFGIYKKQYAPKNMVLVIYGNVGLGRAEEEARRCFGGFSRNYVGKKREVARETQDRREVEMRRKSLSHSIVGVGFKCSEFRKAAEKEMMSMFIASNILSDRLYDEIRDRRGLSYDPSTGYYPYSTFGFIGAQAGTEPGRAEEVKEVMLNEFGRLARGEISEKEFRRARDGMSVKYRMRRESTVGMAISTAAFTLLTGDYRFAEKIPEKLKGVGLEDVKRCCRKYIKEGKHSLLILRP